MEALALICHPATPCTYVSAVTARVDRLSEDLLILYYQVVGDIDQLQLPAQHRSAHTDGLWQHTCFEAFVRAEGARNYLELNFSPSSEWAVYRFDDYRRGMTAIEPPHAPKILCRRREARLEADVDVHLSRPAAAGELAARARSRARGSARSHFVLGAEASAGQCRLPSRRRLCIDAAARRRRGMKFGIDRLLAEPALRSALHGKRRRAARASGVGHRRPHAFARRARAARRSDAHRGIRSAARPARRQAGQHGRVADFNDPVHGIPVFSLYGEVRRPTAAMMDTFDVLLVDLQDRRLPHLHLHHHAASTCSKRRRSTARASGFSIGRIRPAGRSKACACARAGKASSARGRCRCVTA